MDRVDKLRAARDSYAVRYRDFIQIFTKRPWMLVCLFEGDDIKYYGPRIDLLRPDLEWEGLNCGGKDTVLKLYRLIESQDTYAAAARAYFIDRDFDSHDDFKGSRRVYVTPCYSVENLYVNEAAAVRVLRSEFGLNRCPDDDGVFAACLRRFNDRLQEFVTTMEVLNGWILFQRRAEAKLATGRRLNLNSLNLKQLVAVSLESVTGSYGLFELVTMMPGAHQATAEEVLAAAREFDPARRHLDFRGKFQAHFMRVFFTKLSEDANQQMPVCFVGRRHVSLNLSERNFLSDLSQHAETPACLRRFLAALN